MSELTDKLLDLGYKKYENHDKEFADAMYQLKVVGDDGKTLYFLNAYYYPRQELFSHLHEEPLVLHESLCYDVQFYVDGRFFDVEISTIDVSFAHKFFHDMYHAMNCTPYSDL